MALNGLILDQRNNTSKNWRNILAEVFGDGILNGCGITSTSNSITVGGGYFVLKGNVIENNGADTIAVTPELTNGYVRLRCRIDLTQEASETGAGQVKWMIDFSATTTFPALTQEDINSAGSIYEGELAVCGLVAGNITTVTRKMGEAVIDAEKLNGLPGASYAQKSVLAQAGGAATVGSTAFGNVTATDVQSALTQLYNTVAVDRANLIRTNNIYQGNDDSVLIRNNRFVTLAVSCQISVNVAEGTDIGIYQLTTPYRPGGGRWGVVTDVTKGTVLSAYVTSAGMVMLKGLTAKDDKINGTLIWTI